MTCRATAFAYPAAAGDRVGLPALKNKGQATAHAMTRMMPNLNFMGRLVRGEIPKEWRAADHCIQGYLVVQRELGPL